jgi:uncharacterized membrane protein
MEADSNASTTLAGSTPPASSSSLASPSRALIDYTHWIYALHALSVLSALLTMRIVVWSFAFGLPSIIAVIMNYARRLETRGTWLESHFRWQIRTFWYAWLWIFVTSIVAMPLLLVGIGFILGLLGLGIVGLWVIYRVGRGWLTLREARPMPLPPA